MIHTDTDIAEILQRFDEEFGVRNDMKDFITRECLALKKKWEREHFDNQ